MFAVLSARNPFTRVPDELAELDTKGEAAAGLWGWKLDSYRYLCDHGPRVWREVLDAGADTEKALHTICQVPGLGIVKGAFVLQMLGHDIACLDTRNIAREARDPNAYKSGGHRGKSSPKFRHMVLQYIGETGGKAKFYWDTWCREIASVYDMDADSVSAMHLAVIPTGWLAPSELEACPIYPVARGAATIDTDIPF